MKKLLGIIFLILLLNSNVYSKDGSGNLRFTANSFKREPFHLVLYMVLYRPGTGSMHITGTQKLLCACTSSGVTLHLVYTLSCFKNPSLGFASRLLVPAGGTSFKSAG